MTLAASAACAAAPVSARAAAAAAIAPSPLSTPAVPAASAAPATGPGGAAPAGAPDADDPCGGPNRLLATLNRPTVGYSACAVPAGSVVLEDGYQLTSAAGPNASVTAAYPQGFQRLGVAKNVEIDLIGPAFTTARGAAGVTSGAGDFGIGAKDELRQSGRFTYAVDGLFTTPNGDPQTTLGGTSEQFNVDASYAISPAIGVGTTLAGYAAFGPAASGAGGPEAFGAFVPSVVVTAQIPGGTQFYLEGVGQSKLGPGQGGRIFLDGGVQKLVGRNVELDVEYGRSLQPLAAGRFQYLGAGFGWRVR